MNKHRKDRYTRLSIVASQDKQPSRRQTPQRLWVTQSAGFFKASNAQPAAEVSAGNRRMTVMPKLSRGWALSIVANLGNCIRSYFVNGPARQRRAAVLSFRRHAFRMHAWRGIDRRELCRQEGQWECLLEQRSRSSAPGGGQSIKVIREKSRASVPARYINVVDHK